MEHKHYIQVNRYGARARHTSKTQIKPSNENRHLTKIVCTMVDEALYHPRYKKKKKKKKKKRMNTCLLL